MQRPMLRKAMKMTMKSKKTDKATDDAKLFSKRQIVLSEKYSPHRDLVEALLKDDEMYTTEMVDAMIDNYAKGKVI